MKFILLSAPKPLVLGRMCYPLCPRLLALFFLALFISSASVAQNSFVKLVDGKMMRVKVTKFSEEGITYKSGETEIQVKADDIAFVELETEGLMYFNYDTEKVYNDRKELEEIAAKKPMQVLEKGRKVYIPISSPRYKETLGGFDLRERIEESGIWNLVYTPHECDFVLKYYWNDNSDGTCRLEFRDFKGDLIYKSLSIPTNRNPRPVVESQNNIQMLYDIAIRQLVIDMAAEDIISDLLIEESQNTPMQLLKKGRSVFCKYANPDKVSYFGSQFFRYMIDQKGYWKTVDSEREAEFILTFVYDEEGRDHCYFLLSDRTGKTFYQSGSTKAEGEDQAFNTVLPSAAPFVMFANSWFRNWEPTERAYESAKVLFSKQMPVLHKDLNKMGINKFKFDFSLKH